jgi:steroid delta-isomerase
MGNEMVLRQLAAIPVTQPRERVEATIATFLGSYKAKDVPARAALFADETMFEDPIGAPIIRGKPALVQFFKDTVASGVDIEMESEKIIASGNEALSITRAAWGFPGSEPARVRIFQIFAFADNGKIVSLRIFMDRGCLL